MSSASSRRPASSSVRTRSECTRPRGPWAIAGSGVPALDLCHERTSRRPSRHCGGAAQSRCRRCRRQPGTRPPRARAGRERWRRRRRLSRTFHRRISAGGSGAQARVPGGVPYGGRSAGARDRRRRPGRAHRHALGRGRQALQRLRPALRGPDRGDPLQGRSAELRRVRREARVRAGADARARS